MSLARSLSLSLSYLSLSRSRSLFLVLSRSLSRSQLLSLLLPDMICVAAVIVVVVAIKAEVPTDPQTRSRLPFRHVIFCGQSQRRCNVATDLLLKQLSAEGGYGALPICIISNTSRTCTRSPSGPYLLQRMARLTTRERAQIYRHRLHYLYRCSTVSPPALASKCRPRAFGISLGSRRVGSISPYFPLRVR